MTFGARMTTLPRSSRRVVLAAAAGAFAALALTAPRASADISLPPLFGDRMVMQANELFAMWGSADPGESVTVYVSWKTDQFHAVADAAGHWLVKFPAPRPGGPYTLRVAGKNDVTLSDVLAGEVWLCAGQSNMEMSVGDCTSGGATNAKVVLEQANHPDIRYFDVKNTTSLQPKFDCEGRWSKCDPTSVSTFSATAYYFAVDLSRELKMPIGVLEADWGGTPVETWTSAEGLAPWPEFAAKLRELEHDPIELMKPGQFEALYLDWYRALDAVDSGAGGDSRPAWSSLSFDDSDWPEIEVPATWSGDLASFDGFVWCRRTIELGPDWTGRVAVLELGPIDDMDSTFVNGVKVGETVGSGKHEKPRAYELPAGTLRAGRNVIAVRVLDTGGLGGINGRDARVDLRAQSGEVVPLSGKWRAHTANAMSSLPKAPYTPSRDPIQPTSLYNGMIAPLVPYRLRGVLWYQGEANRRSAYLYRARFPAMIADWRRHFAQGDFPFYFVQIAPFGYEPDNGEAAELREAQTMALSVPNTGMAVTMDVGDPADIHPKNKQPVGKRLARIALSKTYGRKELECSGPMYASMKVEASSIRLSFDHAHGLTSREKSLEHFTIAGSDEKFVPATASIDGETVLVSSDAVKAPVAVRYCWGAADLGTLFNGDGLPAPSFRTDEWRGLTVPSAH
jgi:sialate O-acetylesterase